MSNILRILNNKQCQIILEDNNILRKLQNKLSYRMVGAEYSFSYQQGGWNGIVYLVSKTGKFSYGLLPKVKNFLDTNYITYNIEDKREKKIIEPELDISENLKKHNLIPRDHQIRILNAAMATDRGIIRAATGSGKTLATALITAKINKPTVIYCVGLDILDQFHKLFSKLFNEEIGYVGNGLCNIQRINIVSLWTVGRALKLDKNIIDDEIENNEKDLSENNKIKMLQMLKQTKLHVIDECHYSGANTVQELYKFIDPEYLYGFSGTPYPDTADPLLIESILGSQIINVSASELIKVGLLAQPMIKFYSVPKLYGAGDNYQSVYKNYIVENEIRNSKIIEITKELIEKKYTPLVLFKQIKHGKILLEKMLEAGLKCEMLDGSDDLDQRNDVKEKLVSKEIDVIVASSIFNQSVDIPELNALILAGGGKSSTSSLQKIGRVIRMFTGKKIAAVVDFYDQVKYLKTHSLTRYKIYSSEDGFKIIKSKEMK